MPDEFTAGQRPTAEALNRAVLKITGRGNRTTNKTGVTTQAGMLRLDNQSLKAGYVYLVMATGMRGDSSTNTDTLLTEIRYSTSGAASTASTLLVKAETPDQISTTLFGILPVAADATYSFLLTVGRAIGGGTLTWFSEGNGTNLFCINIGLDPGDTGTDI